MTVNLHRISRMAAVALILLLCVLMGAAPALAAGGSVTYTGDAEAFVFEPGSDRSPTDLFDSFKGVMPGDSLTQRITIKNDDVGSVKLYLRAQGASPGAKAFLSQLGMTVTQQGGSELFAAPADQTAGLTDWVCLGTFYPGAKVELEARLDVPISLNDSFQNAAGTVAWEFMAEEYPVSPDDPPKTGESGGALPFALLTAASGLLIIGLIAFRRRQKCQ